MAKKSKQGDHLDWVSNGFRKKNAWILLLALHGMLTPLFGQTDLTIASRLRFGMANADVPSPADKAVLGLDAGANRHFLFFNYHNVKERIVKNGNIEA